MGKVTIELSIKDGKLYYRDSDNNQGSSIITHAKAGDKITWEVAKDSEIKDLTGINIVGTSGFFIKGPSKKGQKKWKATIGDVNVGEIKYYIYYDSNTTLAAATLTAMTTNSDDGPPKIEIP